MLGATPARRGYRFRVWAPDAHRVVLHLRRGTRPVASYQLPAPSSRKPEAGSRKPEAEAGLHRRLVCSRLIPWTPIVSR